MLFVWQGAAVRVCACSHVEAKRGNLNCHMASALGNSAPLLHVTTSLMCTFSHQLEERKREKYRVGLSSGLYMHMPAFFLSLGLMFVCF